MKRICLMAGLILGLLHGAALAHASGAAAQGGSGGAPAVGKTPTLGGGAAVGFGGMAGGFTGIPGRPNGGASFGSGFGGCFGGCQFTGCFGGGGFCGMGGCPFNGCFGGFGSFTPQQFYSDWQKFPGRSFYHRSLYVSNGFTYQPLTIIHYTDRPQYFYFYDPAQKKYVGRFRRGAKEKDCFAVIVLKDRRATLGEITEKSYKRWSAMPSLTELAVTIPVTGLASPAPQLIRPPDTLPGHDLPPDELLEK